jgi:hypothetical protein
MSNQPFTYVATYTTYNKQNIEIVCHEKMRGFGTTIVATENK